MSKLIIGISILLILVSFLSPGIREFLNEKVQSIFREEREKSKESQIIGSVDIYNPRVEEIQRILGDAGFDPGPTDGRMGWRTRDAIREFQKAKGLTAHGKIDPKTWEALNREKEALSNLKKEKTEEPLFLPLLKEKPKDTKSKEEILKIMGPQEKMKAELPKDKAKQIQLALKNAGFDPGPIDGKIGKKTRRAIREFQKAKELKVDGVVGEKTWSELKKYLKER